jgi:hypothetical protein
MLTQPPLQYNAARNCRSEMAAFLRFLQKKDSLRRSDLLALFVAMLLLNNINWLGL